MALTFDSLRRTMRGRPPVDGGAPAGSRVFVVASGRGGLGTSVLAALLALGLGEGGRDGRDALLIDGDDDIGTLPSLLGLHGATAPLPLERLRDPALDPGRLMAPVARGLRLLDAAGSDPDGPGCSPLERQALLQRVSPIYGAMRATVIDAGARFDSVRAHVQLGATRLLAVVTADPVAVATTYALIKGTHAIAPLLPVSVLVNGVQPEEGRQLFDHLAAGVRRFLPTTIELAGVVPEDPSLRSGIRAGMTILEAGEQSLAADALARIGRTLLGLDVAGDALPPLELPIAADAAGALPPFAP